MMILFVRFLREELDVCDKEIAIHVLLHTRDQDVIRVQERFWLEALGLPDSSLRKTVYKEGNPRVRHHTLEHGVCHVGVNRVAVVQHIFGAFQQSASIEKPEWLDGT